MRGTVGSIDTDSHRQRSWEKRAVSIATVTLLILSPFPVS